MRRPLSIVCLTLALAPLGGCCLFEGLSSAPTPIAVADVVKDLVEQVQNATDIIAKNPDVNSTLGPLKKAELKLASKTTDAVGGEAGMVLVASAEASRAESGEIVLTLVPRSGFIDSADGPGAAMAASVIEAVKALDGVTGFTLSSVSVTASVEVTWEASVGASVELSGISIGGSGSRSRSRGHSLKLEFGRS